METTGSFNRNFPPPNVPGVRTYTQQVLLDQVEVLRKQNRVLVQQGQAANSEAIARNAQIIFDLTAEVLRIEEEPGVGFLVAMFGGPRVEDQGDGQH